jgi:hypothetical protein
MRIPPHLATALTLALLMPAACIAATVKTQVPTVQPKTATVKPVSGANSRNLPFVDSKPNTGPRGSGPQEIKTYNGGPQVGTGAGRNK